MRKLARTERTAKNRRDSWPQTWMYYLAGKYSLKHIREKTFGKIDSEKELKDYLGKQVNPILGFQNGESFSMRKDCVRHCRPSKPTCLDSVWKYRNTRKQRLLTDIHSVVGNIAVEDTICCFFMQGEKMYRPRRAFSHIRTRKWRFVDGISKGRVLEHTKCCQSNKFPVQNGY